MKLTTEDVILITNALRQKAESLTELSRTPHGKSARSKAYREGQREAARHYFHLADAFNAARTVVTLETRGTGKYPADYDSDTGVAMTFDTLCDRGHDSDEVAELIDGYDGDLWMDVFGPAVDSAAEAIGLEAYPEED